MYKLNKQIIIHSELDNYKNGCDLNSSKSELTTTPLNEYWNNLTNLVNAITDYIGVGIEHCTLDSCEEKGRIDVQWHSRMPASLSQPNKLTLNCWERGDVDLYLNTMCIYITQIDDKEEEKEVSLQTALGLPEYPEKGTTI
jgi:hypothetical protein